MQFTTDASVFPVKMTMHVPDREHIWPFKAAIRSGEVKPTQDSETNAAWQLLVNGKPIAQGRCGQETQWLHNDFTKLVEVGDKVLLKVETDPQTNKHKNVTLSLTMTGHFPHAK